jgi:hypothetical protein
MRYKNYKKFYSNLLLYTKPSFIITSLFFYKGFTLPKKFYFSKQTSKNSLQPIFLHSHFFSPKVNYIRFYCQALTFTKLRLLQPSSFLTNFDLFLKLLSNPLYSHTKYEPEFIIFFNKVFRNFSTVYRNILLESTFVGQLISLFVYKLLFQTVLFFKSFSNNGKKKLLVTSII